MISSKLKIASNKESAAERGSGLIMIQIHDEKNKLPKSWPDYLPTIISQRILTINSAILIEMKLNTS